MRRWARRYVETGDEPASKCRAGIDSGLPITCSYLNSLRLARHGLKFNENPPAIKLLDTAHADDAARGEGRFVKCILSSVTRPLSSLLGL